MAAPGQPPDRGAPPGYSGPPPTGMYQYPPWPYPPYPPAYPPYAPYPAPAARAGDGRPGAVTAAAVVGWVLAGLLLLAAGLLFFGAAFLRDFDAVNGTSTGSYVAEFTIDALVDVVTAGLLIAGGIGLTNRSAPGRVLLTVGASVVVAVAVYWLARWGDRSGGTIVGYAVIFGSAAAVAGGLTWTGAAGEWLSRHRA
jgi:hypothetical protein